MEETVCKDVDWIQLVQDRAAVNRVMNFQLPWKEGNFVIICITYQEKPHTMELD